MSMPSSNWAAGAFRGAFQKTFSSVFYSRGVSTRRRRTRRPAQQISLESLEPRQMLSVNPAISGSSASSATDNSNIAAFVSQNTIGILSTVPGIPTAVVAASGNASLAVTWTAPANTGGSVITDYLVKYSSNGGAAWTNFIHPVSIVPSLTVTGLANGTTYVIKVIAVNAVGISLPSANSAPVTPATVPGSPTSVVAVRGNTQLAVTWVAPVSTGGSNITDYVVKYSSNSGSTWTTFADPVSTVPSLTVTGLANGTSYVIKVIAKNAVGISLPSANSAPVTPALLAMSRVTVGNPGNAADTSTGSLYGAVSYSYQIGAYDVTGSQYTAFLNAVGSTDTYALYNASMGTNTTAAQISRSGTAGTYTYAVMNSTGNRPITYVSWFDCARFSNWMSNGQPNGAQVSTTTENGTYNVNGATSGNAVAKNVTNPNTGSSPTFRIPLENEWYKAAYYTQGAIFGGYYAFATRSDSAPGTTIGGGANQANYNTAIGHSTDVGAFSGSGSFYGTFDQSGNVYQWNDLGGAAGSSRGLRGGGWYDNSSGVSSSYRGSIGPSYESIGIGFRLASRLTVPGSPTAVVAVSGNDQLTVTWTAPASTGGSPITDYLVKYSSNNGSTWTNVFHQASIVPSLTVTGLTNGTAYVIKVIAKNAVGISLPSANSAPVTPALLAMSMVTVGNSGNAADAKTGSLYGAVSYSYQIGTYDVTGSQYTAFLNAVGSTDTYALYNTSMGTDPNSYGVAQISRSGTAGTYTYAVMNSTGNRPITYVNWFDCARFSNWMSNGQPNGAQSSTTTENGAYYLNGKTTGNAVAKNATNPNTGSAPTFRIPLENEWYKAAYYSPNYGGTSIGGYWTYATQRNTVPGTTIGSSPNQANYNNAIGTATDVGSFTGSGSFYGTFDQSGNMFQWNDLDGTTNSSRGLRGGFWFNDSNGVSSSFSFSFGPTLESGDIFVGFRLASPV